MKSCLVSIGILAWTLSAPPLAFGQETSFVAGPLWQVNDNGAWSWFMDERAIVADGKLIVGSVRSRGDFQATQNDPNWGNVEIAVCDLTSGLSKTTILHKHFEQDDHNGPALLALPDRRILALYTKHGQERKIYMRTSEPGNPLAWGPVSEFVTPGREGAPFKTDNVTYDNLFLMPSGRIYNFFRGPHLDPNYMVSDDNAKTWTYGGH